MSRRTRERGRTLRHVANTNDPVVVAEVSWRLHPQLAAVAHLEAVRAGVHPARRRARAEAKVEVVEGADDDGLLARVDLVAVIVVVVVAQVLDVAACAREEGVSALPRGR